MKAADWTFDPSNKPAKSTRVSLDLETFLLSPCVQAPNTVAMGFSVEGGPVQIVAANDPAFDGVIEALFSDPSVLVFGHNIRYDIIALLAHGARFGLGHWPSMLFGALQRDSVTCTQLREMLLAIAAADPKDANRKYDLGTCAARRKLPTQPNKADEWRLRWGELAHLPVSAYPADASKYLVEDVKACFELYQAQQARSEWVVDQFRQTRAAVCLGLISAWGFATDRDTVEEVYAETAADLETARAVCTEHGLVRPDGSRNVKAASARLVAAYAALGKPVPMNEPTAQMQILGKPGNVQVNDEACTGSGDHVLAMYARASQSQSLIAKVERLRHPVIQASFLTLMETGRTGCTQGKPQKAGESPIAHGFQLQNLPRAVMHLCRACGGIGCPDCKGKGEVEGTGVRECFVARPGHVLLDIDYAAMELRTLAQIERWWFGASDLGDILNDETRCPHVEMGAMIQGVAPADAYAMKRTNPKRFKNMRQMAKAANFGTPGGMGYRRLIDYAQTSYGVELTEDQSKDIIATTKRIYRQRGPYLNRVGAWAEAAGGRFRFTHPYSGRVRGGLNFTNGANGPFQALAADAAKEALWRVTVHCYVLTDSPLYGSRPVNFVHDQVLVEVPEATFREAAKALQEQWCGGAQHVVPDIKILAEPAACRRWDKAAGDPVYDSAGRLAIYGDTLNA